MNGKVILAAVAAASALCACQSSKVRISGRIVGNEARSIYLEQVTPLSERIIDSAQLDKEGNYRFELREAPASPSLYNVVYDGERIPLLLAAGDRLTLSSVGSVARNYTVEGSAESELLRQFYQNYVAGVQRLDEIAQQVARQEAGEQHDELVKAYTEEYYRIRREQLRFIIENKSSLAALFALYQRLPGDANLFNGDSDVVYYRTVAEALEKSYPDSPYLPVLLAEIGRMDARLNLASQLTVTGYPDLELSNIYGKKVRLSSLEGKVILVDFWSAELGNGNARNAELKELYRKYERAGAPFEIYQVAIDTSKPLWITAVQEQQLPWVSVSDLQGGASPTLKLYNVQRLPTSFLISREGEIVARDLDGEELARKIEELLQ
ncbi:TlpA disulfide reductase family protein [uncultured Alistipes sp.]|uniref:TlpA disulfide reductase family protein n=1 Tax=uncultured Alistipes sp. TaxID=538949 RepID=UPI001FA38714|nr:TlpA disulfide reductase family protein [uncultured Alistipes sp.]HJC18006.1 AhpC/TSA family protein [Candidatus Alistipes stercorigallinarum]